MKKSLFALAILCLAISYSYAQKVDLDRHYIKVKYTNLPTDPILDADLRTYSVSSNNSRIANDIKLYGFEKLADKGTLNIDVTIESIIIDNVEIKKREKVNKDKEGNVKSVERYYTPVITYTTRGSYKIDNSLGKPRSYGLGGKNTHKGSEYNSYAKASSYFKNNKYSLKSKFRNEFISNSISNINKNLNKLYGYEPYTYNDLFWILDSKKNSDFEGHQKALKDIKGLLAKVSHDEPVEGLKPELKPIEDYFLSVIPNYPEDKKRHRKMKYASYYNLGRLYYHFDMPDKAIEYANKLIENDYDKSDGKKLIRESNRLKELFEVNKITSRHFPVETVDNSGSTFVEETVAEEQPKKVSEDKYIETIFTNADGTKVEGKLKLKLASDIDTENLDLTNYIKNSIKLMTLTDDDEVKSKNYFAREGASFTANGATYKAVKFKPNAATGAQANVVSLDGAKYHFAKVLYKSDKLSLYKYKKELIFMKTGDKKAQSTSSLAYTIGFKKKLAKLVADCPDLAKLAKEGSFSNTEESLLAFVQEYNDNCK